MPSASSNSRLPGVRLDGRDRLLHPAEDDPRPLALERDRHDAAARLEPDLDQLQRRGEHEGGSQRRMARERDLLHGREDANARVPSALGSEDEDRLGQVRLARQLLHAVGLYAAAVGEHGDGVAGERRVGEDVRNDVSEVHGPTLRRTTRRPGCLSAPADQ